MTTVTVDDGCLWCGTDIERDGPQWPFCTMGCRIAWWQDGE